MRLFVSKLRRLGGSVGVPPTIAQKVIPNSSQELLFIMSAGRRHFLGFQPVPKAVAVSRVVFVSCVLCVSCVRTGRIEAAWRDVLLIAGARLGTQKPHVIFNGRPRSMYMKCPYEIGRDSWVWGEQEAL